MQLSPAIAAMPPSRRNLAALAAVFGLALALRVWGIGFGLPYDFTADEPHHIIQALKIGAGEGGPLVSMWHTVGKSGLDYILFGEYALLYVMWWLSGRVDGPQAFALRYLQDPTAFYLLGRLTIAAMGALTAVLVFWIGDRLYNRRVAIGAALLAAASYHHAITSHIINVHVAMAFTLWAALAMYLSYERSGSRRSLVVSGVLIGAAIALAYTASIWLVILLAVISSQRGRPCRRALGDAALLLAAAGVTVALTSPDLVINGASLVRNFSQLLAMDSDAVNADRTAIDSVTILRQQEWTAYLNILLKPYNLLLTVSAITGAAIGVWRRDRWSLVLSIAIVCLLLIVSASDRGESESYLFPVFPALWLLGSRGIEALSAGRKWAYAFALAGVLAVPVGFLVRDDFTLTRSDTRVLAKRWIETNVPSGAKILMDGMRFRFVQSPPLNPAGETVRRRLAAMDSSELALSEQMLSLYRTAAERVDGPVYDLYSTVYGLEVEDLDHYVRAGFSYIVVSSYHENRYASESESRRHPSSARFYRQLRTDPRFEIVYSIEPAPWKRPGPSLTVYKVRPNGSETADAAGKVS